MGFKVGLALGGGGVRGLAHIGLFKALEEQHIPVDLIVGTSMGAIVGGAYALSKRPLELEHKILQLLRKEQIVKLETLVGESRPEEKKMIVEALVSFVKELLLWNLKGVKRQIVKGKEIRAMVKELVQSADFSQTQIPFACVACDLKIGEEVILTEGLLLNAIMASTSVPGVFTPIQLGGRLLVDGGTTSEVPTEAARKLGADFVIAVNVEQKIFNDNFRHGMDILFQSDEIRTHELVRLQLKMADFVINPTVEDFSWAAFSKAKQCIQAGEQALQKALPALRSAITKKKRNYALKRFFSFGNI